jgi:hypothetical protein
LGALHDESGVKSTGLTGQVGVRWLLLPLLPSGDLTASLLSDGRRCLAACVEESGGRRTGVDGRR